MTSLRLFLTILCTLPMGFYLLYPHELRAEKSSALDQQIRSRNRQILELVNKRTDTLSLIEELKKREWGVLEVLDLLNKNICSNQRKLDKLSDQVEALRLEMTITSGKIRQLRIEIQQDQERVNEQLFALFRLKRTRDMTRFVGLGSFRNFVRNQHLIQRATETEARILKRLGANIQALETTYALQQEQQTRLVELKIKREEQATLLKFEQQQQSTYLHHIRQDNSTRVKYLREIQVELERLNDVIHSLESQKEAKSKFKTFSGLYHQKYALPSPVKGNIVHRFGQKQSPFYTLHNRGVLVETQENEVVHSVFLGKVVWSGPMRHYHNVVILDHGKGSFSVYGNLDEVFVMVDEIVEQSDEIGTVARNEVEDRDLFYFSIRFNKRPVNPVQWLKKPAWK